MDAADGLPGRASCTCVADHLLIGAASSGAASAQPGFLRPADSSNQAAQVVPSHVVSVEDVSWMPLLVYLAGQAVNV